MDTAYRAVKVTDSVYWVGAIDWELADFHGYATPRGSTYNAFLVMAEKVTLIDTVKSKYTDEMMSRIASVIPPEKIDYIISNHSEMDHSGAFPIIAEKIKPERVFASAKGVKALNQHFSLPFEVEAVKEGQTVSLGNMNATFMMTSMVHWPDSMFTYIDKEEILFTNDAFGMHVASSERFSDELEKGVVKYELAKYYANIVWPTSKAVGNVLKKVGNFEKPINIIAPDHGPVWRDNLEWVLDLYGKWSRGEQDPKKAVIVFDTMWGSTAKMARAIAEGLSQGGMHVKVMPLAKTDRSDIVAEFLDAGLIVLGSPSLNSNIFPTVADITTYASGLRPPKPSVKGAVFGSYGWSPAAQKHLAAIAESMGIELIMDNESVNFVPNAEDIESCVAYGKELANKVL